MHFRTLLVLCLTAGSPLAGALAQEIEPPATATPTETPTAEPTATPTVPTATPAETDAPPLPTPILPPSTGQPTGAPTAVPLSATAAPAPADVLEPDVAHFETMAENARTAASRARAATQAQ